MKLQEIKLRWLCQCGRSLKVHQPAEHAQKHPSLAQLEYSCDACPNKFFVHIQETKGNEQKPKKEN